jgi:RNA polymerase sigma-70 factor (ECF subfamily)
MKADRNKLQIALKDTDFEWTYKTCYHALCRYAEGIIKQKEEAEDVVGDLFLMLWENRENIHIEKSLQSFLYRGVRNNSLKFLQHKKVMSKYCEHVHDMYAADDWLCIHEHNDPLSIMILQETKRKIDDAIAALPAQCREVFYRVKIEGLKYQEVADIMGISIGTVRKQISRAMTKLQESIEDMG